jgi:hypothetical protein
VVDKQWPLTGVLSNLFFTSRLKHTSAGVFDKFSANLYEHIAAKEKHWMSQNLASKISVFSPPHMNIIT